MLRIKEEWIREDLSDCQTVFTCEPTSVSPHSWAHTGYTFIFVYSFFIILLLLLFEPHPLVLRLIPDFTQVSHLIGLKGPYRVPEIEPERPYAKQMPFCTIILVHCYLNLLQICFEPGSINKAIGEIESLLFPSSHNSERLTKVRD